MRKLKSILVGIALLFISAAANATVKPDTSKLATNKVIKIYIDAATSGHVSELNNVLAGDLRFNIQMGDYVKMLGKNGLIDHLKNNVIYDPSVKTSTNVIKEDDHSSVIEVEFMYDGYTRTDELTLNKTFGWVITSVECLVR